MLMIRRSYRSCKLPKLPISKPQQTSIGKLLQTTNKSCPRRNNVLGKHFCRFAVRLKQYTEATSNSLIVDTNHLQNQFDELISKLDLNDPFEKDSNPIRLPSTGQLLSTSINKSLDKWKCNAYDEVKEIYCTSNNTTDELMTETVREINYSLIGWFLQTYGMQNTFAFIQWLGIPLFTNPSNCMWLQPKSPLQKEFNDHTKTKLNQLLDGYDTFQQKIRYNFQNKAYLLQSITHHSFTSNDLTPDYHGLDFIGDAILNYLIVRHLFRQPVYLDADELSEFSTLLYCNSSIATISIRNDLHKYLRYTTPELRDDINSFVAFLRRNKFKPVDDVYFLDKKNFVFEVPPIISSSFEALLGAIYFDSNMNLNDVSNSIIHLMGPDIRAIYETKPKNIYAILEKLDSNANFSSPITVAPGQVRVEVTLPKYKNMRFSATSRDPLLAKWGAAKSAIIRLKNQPNIFIRTKHNDYLKKMEAKL